jgi:hypothetical protein
MTKVLVRGAGEVLAVTRKSFTQILKKKKKEKVAEANH